MFIKCSWYEPASGEVEHGIIPTNWIVMVEGKEVVRWPNRTNVKPLMDKLTPPETDWQIFILVKNLSFPGNEVNQH